MQAVGLDQSEAIHIYSSSLGGVLSEAGCKTLLGYYPLLTRSKTGLGQMRMLSKFLFLMGSVYASSPNFASNSLLAAADTQLPKPCSFLLEDLVYDLDSDNDCGSCIYHSIVVLSWYCALDFVSLLLFHHFFITPQPS